MNICQTEVATRIAVGQTFMVKSEQMQNRCVQIMHVNPIFDGMHSEFIGRAVHGPSAYSAACEEH